MPTFRYRDEDTSKGGMLLVVAGALAGLAAGVIIAQRFGGVSGITGRVRDRFGNVRRRATERWRGADEFDDYEDDSFAAEGSELEERVLEAFLNDPIMSERAVDIGAIGEGIIELTGWVYTEDEADHAVTLTRGVPGVDTVVNRLDVREEEEVLEDNRKRFESGDPALNEARWEGVRVGTGRRRQGTSAEADRHADPKPILEERALREQQVLAAAAEDVEGIAERRQGNKRSAPKGDRTGGSPVAPSGVPKGDHVADPAEAQDLSRNETGRTGELTRRAD